MRRSSFNIIGVLVVLLICKNTFAQSNRYLDSLKALTTSKVDTIRFWTFSELVWELKDVNKTAALEYANNLIEQASKSNNAKWHAQGLNDVGIIYYSSGELDKALNNFEKSLVIRRKLGSKKDIASSLSKIALIKTEKAQYGDALKMQLEVLKIYEELDIKPYICHTCNNIATLYTNINNHQLSKQYLKRAFEIEKQIGDKHGLSVTLGSMSAN